MGDVLIDLDRVLESNQPTSQEEGVMLTWKRKALRDFAIGACVGSVVVCTATWLVTRRQMVNLVLSTGGALYSGIWTLNKSLDSAVDHILALEGSRMQRELADIIAKKYDDRPWIMKRISKHFYSEEVFDDSTSDKPKLRLRYRNSFIDNDTYGQRTSEAATESGSDQPSRDIGPQHNRQNKLHISSSDSPSGSGSEETKSKVKWSPINPGVDLMGDALDCVFGESTMTTREEIHHPTNSAASHKEPVSRSHRRSYRRRRRHQEQEVPLDS